MTSIAELTKDNNCLKQIVKDLKAQLALTQHDLKLAQRDLEKYADEYAGLVAEKDEEIEELKEEKQNANFAMVDDYIFGRLKDICREEDLPYPEFCPAEITNELARAIKLKEEIEKLKALMDEDRLQKANETLKAGGTVFAGKSIPLHPYYQTAMAAMEKEIEELKAEKRPINFDDANMAFYWAATNGDVLFWKVPCELHDLTEEDGETSRVLSAFMRERFGDEWGCLSSHTIRTLTLEILEENE